VHSITLTMVCLRILVFLYQPQSKSFQEVYCRNLPVNPSVHVHVSPNCKSLKTNEPILMKHYTVVVFNTWECAWRKINPGWKYIMGDHSREIITCARQGYPLWIYSQLQLYKISACYIFHLIPVTVNMMNYLYPCYSIK